MLPEMFEVAPDVLAAGGESGLPPVIEVLGPRVDMYVLGDETVWIGSDWQNLASSKKQ